MVFKNFSTWREFFNAYADKENLTLTDFTELYNAYDPIFLGHNSVKPEVMFEFYNSDIPIDVRYDENDDINENDFIIVIYFCGNRYECSVCSPDCFGDECFYMEEK